MCQALHEVIEIIKAQSLFSSQDFTFRAEETDLTLHRDNEELHSRDNA